MIISFAVCRANAERMLGSEGWKPTAKEAVEAGLITEVVPHDQAIFIFTTQNSNSVRVWSSQTLDSPRDLQS